MNFLKSFPVVSVRIVVFFTVICMFLGSCAHANTSSLEAKIKADEAVKQLQEYLQVLQVEVKRKADEAVKQLQEYIDEGNDVSLILPQMQRVKVLGKAGKLEEANALLDKINVFFAEQKAKYEEESKPKPPNTGPFINDRLVTIVGYKGDAMEAFISRDGEYLFFNSDGKNKDIYYASRIDDYGFRYWGEVRNVNTPSVDGVPTMDNLGNFYYISTDKYGFWNRTTVYSGVFKDGGVSNPKSYPSLNLGKPGWLNMDSEISADGKTLYSTHSYFEKGKFSPTKSYFFVARKNEKGDFVIDNRSKKIFKTINDGDVIYGATISSDEREILYTKLKKDFSFESYVARRKGKGQAFGKPVHIEAITGFSEAPALTDDGQIIYYHKKDEDGLFHIHALHRNPDYKWD